MTPAAVTYSHAIVRGKAKKYRYTEPLVAGISSLKDGRLVYKTIDRPYRARRSDALAIKDAKALANELNVPFLGWGSLHNKAINNHGH